MKTVKWSYPRFSGKARREESSLVGVVNRREELRSRYVVVSYFPALVAASLSRRRYGPTPLDAMLADPVASVFAVVKARLLFQYGRVPSLRLRSESLEPDDAWSSPDCTPR